MKVLYYTATPFLDIAIEQINILKKEVELHVIIEVTPGSSNWINVKKLPEKPAIISVRDLLDIETYSHLEPYFNGCASSNFIVHTSKTGFSFSTLKRIVKTWLFIRKLKPDVIHLEVITLRSLGLLPILFSNKKICITLHDPLPHPGEDSWKISLPRFLFLRFPYQRSYFFYSDFSRNQFERHFKKDSYPKYSLRMYPYSYYKKFEKVNHTVNSHILFFGSVTPYKGINVLLYAMTSVLKQLPGEVLVIAGRSRDGFALDQGLIDKCEGDIRFLNRYIPNDELVCLIKEAKFVVCPYLDATQSGVLMTSFALNTPVIATNVGAFPEYIEHNVTGKIVPANDSEKLADAILSALRDNSYKEMRDSISTINSQNTWANNLQILLEVYKTGN